MPHRAFGIYVHITWHTRFHQRLIRGADVDAVRAAIDEAAFHGQVHVHEVAILSDHVHVIASFRPEGGVVSFIRHAKSESSRQINLMKGYDQWARGYSSSPSRGLMYGPRVRTSLGSTLRIRTGVRNRR